MSWIADPTSPTDLDPPLCGVCSNQATLTCRTCNNMQYCCADCQESDAPLHNTICTSFANFQERPSPYHYRAILFDAYEVRPRFIWLLIDGMRGIQEVNKDDWSRYCSGRRSSDITITTDQGFTPPRQFNHRILVEYDEDSLGRGLPANLCLIKLCGPEVARFRGNYIARGYKYRGDTTPDQRDTCDIYIPGGCDIALDLDTTCLGPLVSWFQEYVDFEGKYGGAFQKSLPDLASRG